MVEGLFLVNKVGSCILAVLGAEKILIHGNSWNLFYVFWFQVNKFQIDLN